MYDQETRIGVEIQNKMSIRIILIIFLSLLLSCNVKEYRGVEIPYSLYNRSDFFDHKVKNVIESALDLNPDFLNEFILLSHKVDGESSYDLGFVLTQIINKIGEEEFIKMSVNLNKNDKKLLKSFIRAGLEYGDNDYDGKMDNERIENVYPKINEKF